MTPLERALSYALRSWSIFACQSEGQHHKRPLTEHGLYDATTDPAVITAWWERWPRAWIGIRTGEIGGVVVLDIDVKRSEAFGFDTLEALGLAVLPETPMAQTPSGGLHLYFKSPGELRNTSGARGRGIGPGVDWRGDGGYIIAPSPGSGYEWDPYYNLDTVTLAEVPSQLLPRQAERAPIAKPIKPTIGLSLYAEAALDAACRNILDAPAGEQETTLNAESFAIGTLAGAGGVPPDFARRALIWAARQMPDYDPRRPWRAVEIEDKVNRAFADGLKHPREVLVV